MAGKTSRNLPAITLILAASFFLFLTILMLVKQKNVLKFYSITSHLDTKTKNKIVRDIFREHKWMYVKNKHNYIQVTGNGFRDNIDLRTWSELMTVIVYSDKIDINSICDPDHFFAQAVSFGKNKQNIRDFEMLFLQKILEYEKKV